MSLQHISSKSYNSKVNICSLTQFAACNMLFKVRKLCYCWALSKYEWWILNKSVKQINLAGELGKTEKNRTEKLKRKQCIRALIFTYFTLHQFMNAALIAVPAVVTLLKRTRLLPGEPAWLKLSFFLFSYLRRTIQSTMEDKRYVRERDEIGRFKQWKRTHRATLGIPWYEFTDAHKER